MSEMFSVTVALFLASFSLSLIYLLIKYVIVFESYWKRNKIPYIKPHRIFGNLKDMLTLTSCPADQFRQLYNHENAKDQPVLGIFVMNRPSLLIRDLELIKSILITDFNKFRNRSADTDRVGDVLGSNNLFFIKNPHWKELRTKMSPVFTVGKLKQMFPLMNDIGNELDRYLLALIVDPETNSCIQEVREISALFTTDAISSVAYGVQANSLKNPNCDFRQRGKQIFEFNFRRAIEVYVIFFVPKFARLLRCKVFSKKSSIFIRKAITFVIEERLRNGSSRNDLIDILLAFKKSVEDDESKKHLAHFDVLIAQVAVFFAAGYDTSSSAMSFAMFELAKHAVIQNRLRMEIKETLIKNNGEFTYETLNDMEYLDMIVQEVLRLYPPLSVIDRECTLSENEKGYSLKPYCDFEIPHDMAVYIPSGAIQRDPKYFPNPNKFDPERFSATNKPDIQPMSYFPFGSGPHGCIGQRFGVIQTKVGLVHFLKNHYITTCEQSQDTLIYDPKALITQPKNGIYCKIVRDPLIKL